MSTEQAVSTAVASRAEPLHVWNDHDVPDRPPEPPSVTIAADLRRRIETGEFQSGQQIPAVRILAEEYGAARRTISKAIAQLESEGLVRVTPNWGTHVV